MLTRLMKAWGNFASKAFLLFVGVALLSLAACSPEKESPKPSPVKDLPTVTIDQWRAALTSAYVTWDIKQDSGQEVFFACFGAYDPTAQPRCASGDLFQGKRDAFDRSYRFRPALGRRNEAMVEYALHSKVYVGFGITIFECDRSPAIVAVVRFGGDSWLFVESFAVLADGNLVIKQQLPFGNVERDTVGRGVTERGVLMLESSEITALKTILAAQYVQVRVTGEKGFVPMSDKQTKNFVA